MASLIPGLISGLPIKHLRSLLKRHGPRGLCETIETAVRELCLDTLPPDKEIEEAIVRYIVVQSYLGKPINRLGDILTGCVRERSQGIWETIGVVERDGHLYRIPLIDLVFDPEEEGEEGEEGVDNNVIDVIDVTEDEVKDEDDDVTDDEEVIDVTDEYGTCSICFCDGIRVKELPCTNAHGENVCENCLHAIYFQSGKCPMCRDPLRLPL